MKTTLYNSKGEKKSQVELPELFSTKVREDIVQKYFEADKFIQPYASFVEAGKRQSASGTISHKRHDWKGHYGRGISRIPRKTMSRRGTQFIWVGANAPGTRGGRRAHPPKGIGKEKKINKKEITLAFNSAFAATGQKHYILKRYSSLEKINSVPFVIESLPKKTKDLIQLIKQILDNAFNLAFKKKTVRAGKGKLRGRKYKSNAGGLIIIGNEEKAKFSGIEVKHLNNITISDLYPLGRLTIYTKKALEELNGENKNKK
ncbi:MAG: 50S ribosomal protein L4 [Nanoarchaeota archaeon]|nr:50S ribosomal protein L4 [Nanoarchaeota archaeon]MBU1051616.1 50S ribosomal protein L4 [Nanoarchaeota archaeon]MBU1988887.1 50S ribosomal protein L4 [Nanoarchaeota archaeon]